MYLIGLTGGIATGKSTVAQALRALGVPVVDADTFSRAATAPGGAALPMIRQRFGDAMFADDFLDRRALGRLVFADPQARAALEAIVHPLVFAALDEALQALCAQREPVAVIEMPLLFETGYDARVDAIWLTDVPQEEQVRRLMARDGLTRIEAQARISSQLPSEEKRSRAHRIIDTSGAPEETRVQVHAAWRQVLQAVHSFGKVDRLHGTTP